MNTKTKLEKDLTRWDGVGYHGTAELYNWLIDQTEYTADCNHEDLLRLTMFAFNGGWSLVEEDLPALMAQEEWAYYGEADSEADFAEEYFISSGGVDEDATRHLVIDWAGTYRYSLEFDFFNFEVIDPETDRYRRFFWNANV